MAAAQQSVISQMSRLGVLLGKTGCELLDRRWLQFLSKDLATEKFPTALECQESAKDLNKLHKISYKSHKSKLTDLES